MTLDLAHGLASPNATSTRAGGPSSHVRSLTVFFPCFNDAQTIGSLVHRTAALLEGLGLEHEILVIDDGSSDDSVERLRALEKDAPCLRLIQHPRNLGYGAVLCTGFREAAMDWVFYTDGDGQYDPTELLDLLARTTPDIDVVQGYKIERRDGLARALVGRIYHHFVKRLFALPIRDTDCDFRLIRTELVRRADLRRASGAICVEMVRRFADLGARFAEVPVHHYPRAHGDSQFFRFGNVGRSLVDLGSVWLDLRRNRRARPRRLT